MSISASTNIKFDLNNKIELTFNNKLSNLSPSNSTILRNKTAILLDELYFELLDTLNIKYFIECGAYDAKNSYNLAVKSNIQAIAIEPNPNTFQELTLKNNHPNVRLLNCGLSDKSGELNFYTPKDNNLAMNSSFRMKSNRDLDNYNINKIKVLKLDNIIEENLPKNSTFALWVDVEGLSDKVLFGCKNYLINKSVECQLIKIEVENQTIWQNQSSDLYLIDYLKSLNYIPIFRDFEYEEQYNIIFIKISLYEKVLELINHFQNQFHTLQLSTTEQDNSIIEKVRFYKNKILSTNNNFIKFFIHIFFAIFGSKSSLKYIKNMFKLKKSKL